MNDEPLLAGARFDVANFGELLSEPARVAMLLALMDGSVRPATELAEIAHVTPPTASAHLARLLDGGLLTVERMGRHRYYQLANETIADALEALALLRPPSTATRTNAHPARRSLSEARTCYRHLAGRLGVAWLGALRRARFVSLREGGVALTPAGTREFEALGMSSSHGASPLAGKLCLDWTERKFHLGGPLGTKLTALLFSVGWLARRGDGRAVRVTVQGQEELARRFAIRS